MAKDKRYCIYVNGVLVCTVIAKSAQEAQEYAEKHLTEYASAVVRAVEAGKSVRVECRCSQ